MLPGMELMGCPQLAVPRDVMHHVVRVESSYNPYAIGVVGGRLARQPRNLAEAVSTARMLEQRGYNFSLGLAQVNRYNLSKYGLASYELAFQPCANLLAGSRILRECYGRSGGDWAKSFSCYYSGDFRTGFRHGYVQKVYASMRRGNPAGVATGASEPIAVLDRTSRRTTRANGSYTTLVQRRVSAPRSYGTAPVPQPQHAMAPPSPSPASPRAVALASVDPLAAAAPADARAAMVSANRISASSPPPSPNGEPGDGAFVF